MCNPRRVVVRLSQALCEDWSREIEAHITVQREISATATLETDIALGDELGDVALQELRGLLAEGFAGWLATDQGYTLALENGIRLEYHPDSGRLQVHAQLSETVEAAARAAGTYSGSIDTSLEVEGSSTWYDDGWGGRTEAHAQSDAERNAQAELQRQRAALIEAEARRQAAAEASVAAEARLREAEERRQAVLQAQLETLLHESEDEVQAAIGNLLGQTYRRAIIRLARDNNGQILRDDETSTGIDLVVRI